MAASICSAVTIDRAAYSGGGRHRGSQLRPERYLRLSGAAAARKDVRAGGGLTMTCRAIAGVCRSSEHLPPRCSLHRRYYVIVKGRTA